MVRLFVVLLIVDVMVYFGFVMFIILMIEDKLLVMIGV